MTLTPTARYRQGSGTPLLLIHAGWTSWRIWTPVLDSLSKERDVLASTMPGHLGGPEVSRAHPPTLKNALDHILSEMDAAGFECPDIVGNSVGGFLAFELARLGRARSVIAICPEGKQSWLHTISLFTRGYLAHQAARRLLPVLRRALRVRSLRKFILRDATPSGHLVPAELAEHLIEAIAYCDVLQSIRSNIDGMSIPTVGDVSDVKCPTYFIWGKQDTFVLKEEIDRYLADLPAAKYLAIDKCGHCPQLDWPELIAQEILAFTIVAQDSFPANEKIEIAG
jgi:pimeloyl-ACP methyl ester carboxylesterase